MKEFVDFLSGQAPYDALTPVGLDRLVRRLDVEFVAAGAVIIGPEADAVGTVWVVRTGLVEVASGGVVVDELRAGDSFGVQSGQTVRAVENSLLYLLPELHTVLESGDLRVAPPAAAVAGLGPVSRLARPIVWCEADTTLQEAARRVTAAGTSCALVHTGQGVAIITDQDFRRSVAEGVRADSPVSAAARRPVLSVAENAPVATAFLRMLEHGVHHLVLTSRSGRPAGVVRVVDLTSAGIRDPLLVREAVRGAATLAELQAAGRMLRPTAVELARSGLPADEAATLVAAVTESILRRLVEPDPSTAASDPTTSRSLFILGSLARRETLPRSDVDTALLLTDAAVDRPWAAAVLERMQSCGLPRCPVGANADAPGFSRTATDWAALAEAGPDEDDDRTRLLLSLAADARPITAVTRGQALLGELGVALRRPTWLAAITRHTLAVRPPAGFVGDRVVDGSGDGQPSLDLKTRGLLPLVALGRWVAVLTADGPRATPDRLHRAVDVGLLTPDESAALVAAHTEIFGLLREREIASIQAGSPITGPIDVRTLDTPTRRRLREAFRAISRTQTTLAATWPARVAAMR